MSAIVIDAGHRLGPAWADVVMGAVTSVTFEIPLRHCPNADIVGVVTIACTHLDAVPDCLLAIAARHSPEHQVVRLSAWPEPDVAVFKVIQGSRSLNLVASTLLADLLCQGDIAPNLKLR